MKKIAFFTFLLSAATTAWSQDYYMATPQGFGANTTGGGSATPVTVTTYAALKSNLQLAGAKVILVSGEITIPSGQPISLVVSNKSVIGLPGAKLINENQSNPGAGILYLKPGSNNVIIRNLIFVGPGAYDIDGQDNLTADGCTNLWVDHCEFQDGQDGNFDNKGLTDNVTVSWCKFTYLKPPLAGGSGGSNDHRFSNLIGSSATNAPADTHYSITFQNCFWGSGCKERMPRARNAELHLLNCYYNTGISSSKAIGLGGGTFNSTCYVEGTDFSNINNVFTSYVSSDGGTIAVAYDNCLNGFSNIGTVAPPAYVTTPMPVGEVAQRLTDASCGAGATLQVSADGVIAPTTCTLNVKDHEADDAIAFYPSLIKNTLHLRFSDQVAGQVQVSIYTIDGKKLLEYAKDIQAGATVEIDLEHLPRGVYLSKIAINHETKCWKFAKN